MPAKLSTTIIGVAALAAGIALLVAAAALSFENGIVADATAGTARMTPVEASLWVIGMMLSAAGTVTLAIGTHARAERQTAAGG